MFANVCVSASTILFVCMHVCIFFGSFSCFILFRFAWLLFILFYFSVLDDCLLPNKIEQIKVWIRVGGEDVGVGRCRRYYIRIYYVKKIYFFKSDITKKSITFSGLYLCYSLVFMILLSIKRVIRSKKKIPQYVLIGRLCFSY